VDVIGRVKEDANSDSRESPSNIRRNKTPAQHHHLANTVFVNNSNCKHNTNKHELQRASYRWIGDSLGLQA